MTPRHRVHGFGLLRPARAASAADVLVGLALVAAIVAVLLPVAARLAGAGAYHPLAAAEAGTPVPGAEATSPPGVRGGGAGRRTGRGG